MKRHVISEAEYEETKAYAKRNRNKRVDKRLQVILLRYEGKKDVEIGEKLGYSRKGVSRMCAEFKRVGLVEYARHKYGGNHRSLSQEEEQEILSKFDVISITGQIITAQDIKRAFDEKLGRDTGRGYIYMLLERHGWRKVMPRPEHPKKASDEVIDASKKLTRAPRE